MTWYVTSTLSSVSSPLKFEPVVSDQTQDQRNAARRPCGTPRGNHSARVSPPLLKLRRASCFAPDRGAIPGKRGARSRMADGVGFEPTRGDEPLPVFKTGALNRSATHPRGPIALSRCRVCQFRVRRTRRLCLSSCKAWFKHRRPGVDAKGSQVAHGR